MIMRNKFLRSSIERKTGAHLAPTVLLISGGKKATILHKEIPTCFQATAQLEDLQFSLWFSEGKTTLIPKPG